MRQNRNESVVLLCINLTNLRRANVLKSDRGNGVASAPVDEEVPRFDALRDKAYHSASPIAAP